MDWLFQSFIGSFSIQYLFLFHIRYLLEVMSVSQYLQLEGSPLSTSLNNAGWTETNCWFPTIWSPPSLYYYSTLEHSIQYVAACGKRDWSGHQSLFKTVEKSVCMKTRDKVLLSWALYWIRSCYLPERRWQCFRRLVVIETASFCSREIWEGGCFVVGFI